MKKIEFKIGDSVRNKAKVSGHVVSLFDYKGLQKAAIEWETGNSTVELLESLIPGASYEAEFNRAVDTINLKLRQAASLMDESEILAKKYGIDIPYDISSADDLKYKITALGWTASSLSC